MKDVEPDLQRVKLPWQVAVDDAIKEFPLQPGPPQPLYVLDTEAFEDCGKHWLKTQQDGRRCGHEWLALNSDGSHQLCRLCREPRYTEQYKRQLAKV